MVRIGSWIQITSENENYDEYRRRIWKVSHIARNKHEHPGYDEGVGGLLVSADGLPISLYEWEFEEVDSPRSKRSKGRKGKGWHGEHQRHKEVAERAQAKHAQNTPMKKTPSYKPPYRVDVWEERDRLIITVYDKDDKEVASWVDEDARQMFKDGFFKSRDLEQSVLEYLENLKIIKGGN